MTATDLYRMTRTGVVSCIEHIHIVVGPQVTTVICDVCGHSHREDWPGNMDSIEQWMQDHLHEEAVGKL